MRVHIIHRLSTDDFTYVPYVFLQRRQIIHLRLGYTHHPLIPKQAGRHTSGHRTTPNNTRQDQPIQPLKPPPHNQTTRKHPLPINQPTRATTLPNRAPLHSSVPHTTWLPVGCISGGGQGLCPLPTPPVCCHSLVGVEVLSGEVRTLLLAASPMRPPWMRRRAVSSTDRGTPTSGRRWMRCRANSR